MELVGDEVVKTPARGWQSSLKNCQLYNQRMKYTITYIRYLDSCLRNDEFSVNHNFKPVMFEAVGFLIKEDAESVSLARELNEIDKEKNARGTITIPKVVIKERYTLERNKTKESSSPSPSR